MQAEIAKNFRYNFVVNVLDGSFFGFGVGFASWVTIVPLFVSTMTNSTTLIGLIASIQLIGWQLPQLFTANRVAGLRRYKPMVIKVGIQERWPFLGLAVIALLIPTIDKRLVLGLTFLLLSWQALGGGLVATVWQTMLGKVMPESRRGTFFGAQSAGYSLLSAVGAVIAGRIIEDMQYPYNYALCFFITGVLCMVSLFFLANTREPEGPPVTNHMTSNNFWRSLREILRRDHNFRRFVMARILSQFASMSVGFYTIYAVRRFGMTAETAGLMTGVLLIGQTIASPLVGWMGDRWGHRRVFALGVLAVGVGALLATGASELNWFYLVFGLAGFANATFYTTTLSLAVEFGTESERPYYIGLFNSLTAPITLLAPILGGFLVNSFSFQAMFLTASIAAGLTIIMVLYIVQDPRSLRGKINPQPVAQVSAE